MATPRIVQVEISSIPRPKPRGLFDPKPVVPSGAAANSDSKTFLYFAGAGPVCELEESACPDVAEAANGDMVSIAGGGSITVHPNSASGGAPSRTRSRAAA